MGVIFILLTTLHFMESNAYFNDYAQDCPSDCICYSDYLHNLNSWKWVETELLYDKDDPEHEQFNPYLEHNEVMENPKLHRKRQKEAILSSVTCMIRTNETEDLEKLFGYIPSSTQVLSLIQAPGAGSVSLKKDYFRKFPSLLGLEINGYGDKSDKTEISGDCFKDMQTIIYLNLESVALLQTSVENNIHDVSSRYVKINYTFNDVETNELESHILIISADKDGKQEKEVLPYGEYLKSLQKEKTAPLKPTFRVAFTGLPKLQHLKMSGCNLHDISWDMFYKLESLKYLVLDENDLLFLPDFVFYATSNLTVLSLSRNRILNLQTVGLAGLLYLQKLDVTHNNITHLSELSLPPFPHLEVADFRHNPITSIFPNTFEIMNSTKSLYLGSTSTPLDLSPNSFFGLSSLSKLDIINVKIRLLEKSMLKGMPLLQTLIMSGSIPRISYDAFGEVTNLQKLILRNCGIKKISMDAFFGLTSLIELDLSHNSLSFLPPGIFEDQNSLREVFLQHNQLTTLPVNLIENLPVKIFRLEANPWHCSCDMKSWNPQQINRIKRYHIPTPNNTLCQKVYDKGSMCFETYEPKFKVTYSYEKRVSPLCETPLKFNHQSVFQVLRRELKFCNSSVKRPDIGKNEISQISSKSVSKAFPDNYSLNTLKALEKQLLAKPVKIKKNKTTTFSNSRDNDNNALRQIDAISGNNENNFISSNLNYDFSPTANSQPPSIQTEYFTRTTESTIDAFPNKSFVNLHTSQNETTARSYTIVPELIQSLPRRLRNKPKGKKKNKSWIAGNNNENRPLSVSDTDNASILPSISKKAMKLARMLKKQSRQS